MILKAETAKAKAKRSAAKLAPLIHSDHIRFLEKALEIAYREGYMLGAQETKARLTAECAQRAPDNCPLSGRTHLP